MGTFWYYGVQAQGPKSFTTSMISSVMWQICWHFGHIAGLINNTIGRSAKGIRRYNKIEAHRVRGTCYELFAGNIASITINTLKYHAQSGTRSFTLNCSNVTLSPGITLMSDTSGSGKSTFARLFCDAIEHDNVLKFECVVTYDDGTQQTLSGVDVSRTFAAHCCYFPQVRALLSDEKVSVRTILGIDKSSDFEANAILTDLGLMTRNEKTGNLQGVLLDSLVSSRSLSPGEQTRLIIARNILSDNLDTARIAVFDEPDGSLDAKSARAVINTIRLRTKTCIVIIITHNKHSQDALSDRPHLHTIADNDGERKVSEVRF